MRLKLVIFPFVAAACYCLSTSAQIIDAHKNCARLKNCFRLASAKGDDCYAKAAFIKNFPDNFKQFNETLGYVQSKQELTLGCLYEESSLYINFFFKSQNCDKHLFYTKTLNIATSSVWESDGMEYFQHNLCDAYLKDEYFMNLLENEDKVIIENVVKFLFDGPVKPKQRINSFLLRTKRFPLINHAVRNYVK